MRQGLTVRRIGSEGADLADEVGLSAVTMSEVARRVGVRVPSLYAHVAGSEELMLRISAVSLDDLADRVAEQLAGRSGVDALRAYGDTVRAFAAEHPGRYAATRQRIAEALADSVAAQETIAAGRRHADLLAAVLRGFAVAGDDAVHATRLIGSVIHGFVSLEASGAFDHSSPPAEESWHRALGLVAGTLEA